MSDPLRLKAKVNDFDARTPEGKERIQNQTRILNAMHYEYNPDPKVQMTLTDAEASMRALESSAKKGTLYDATTVILGILQTTRYTPSQQDNARMLTDTIAVAARQSEPGTNKIKICGSETNCINKPVTRDEIGAVFVDLIPASADMKPNRATYVGTGAAMAHSWIAAANNPSIVTGSQTPEEFTKKAIQDSSSAIQDARNLAKACASELVPSLDLRTCAKAGAHAAVHFLGINKIQFKEVDPAYLVPTPDLPADVQKKFAQERRNNNELN